MFLLCGCCDRCVETTGKSSTIPVEKHSTKLQPNSRTGFLQLKTCVASTSLSHLRLTIERSSEISVLTPNGDMSIQLACRHGMGQQGLDVRTFFWQSMILPLPAIGILSSPTLEYVQEHGVKERV
jgi:hypothetical protein